MSAENSAPDSTRIAGQWGTVGQESAAEQESAANIADSGHGDGILRLLNRELPADYRREWTERIAREDAEIEPGAESVVIFRIGAEWLALPTRVIQEVTDAHTLHTIPHRTDGALLGLVCVRGELLLCACLPTAMGLEKPKKLEKSRMTSGRLLVARRGTSILALPVDEVHGVHRYHARELKDVPDTLSKVAITYSLGLLPWQDKTVACLDDELLFYTLDKSFS